MSTFAFRAVDLAGVPSRGELDATSKSQVTEQLRQRGLIVLDVTEKKAAVKVESAFERFKKVQMRELAVFSRQFATLITSGMPMLRSLYTLEDQTEDERIKAAIVGLRQDVEAGSSVSTAMERHPGVFDPLYRSMVSAGESSGRLETALEMVAGQLEKLDALKRQIKSAMMYPMVVFGFAAVVMLVVVAFIVPIFAGIFEELAADQPGTSAELPAMTQFTVSISELITGSWYIVLPVFGGLLFGFFQWKKTDKASTPGMSSSCASRSRSATWSRRSRSLAGRASSRARSPPACRSSRRSGSPARRPATR